MSNQQRVALVTGAAAGLAKGIVQSLALAGYRVGFTYRADGTSPSAALEAAQAAGAQPLSVAADFSQPGAGHTAVGAIEAHFGRLDVVVHAVGPILVRAFEQCTIADYEAMVDGNLRSAVEIALAALPGMRLRGFGRLVYFGMNGSAATRPARRMALYAAAKAGVVAFARTLAVEEAGRGITVNVLEPGDIRRKELNREEASLIAANNPTGHAGSWEDIADAVRFLVADEASFINGVSLGVNGGLAEPHE